MLLQIQLLDSLIDADLYESKPCKIHNHHQKDGRGIRTKYMRTCVGCRFNLPPGLMDLQFDNIEIRVHKNKKFLEEIREGIMKNDNEDVDVSMEDVLGDSFNEKNDDDGELHQEVITHLSGKKEPPKKSRV